MNNTAKVLRWGYTEIVRVACSNKKANKAADRFIDATIKFCKALRKSADWFGFGIAVVNEDGTIADNKQREKILDEYIRYTHTKKKNEKITIWMSETNLADAIDSQSFENGICIPMLDNGKPEVSLNPVYDYFKSLGILDKVQDMNCSVGYRNAVDIAHFILSDKLNSVINLRNAMSDDHDGDGEICATINLNNRGKSVSDFVMTEDMSILEKNPEKKWFLNVSGVLTGMAFKQDEIKATQQEYEEAAKEYLGERMLTVFEQHPEGVSVLWDCNGLCVSGRELIEKVELIRNSIKFNMLMMKTDNWQDLGADYLPYAELEDDETITYIGEIVAVSEDMEMIRIPLI